MQTVRSLFTIQSSPDCTIYVCVCFCLCRIGILDVINDFSKEYGGPGKFWLGNRLFVYIDDPKHFEIILNTPSSLNKGDSYDFIVESIGHGLITLKCNKSTFSPFSTSPKKKCYRLFSSLADEWRFHRRNLNPSFHYNVVKSFYPTFNKNLKIFSKTLQKYAGIGPFRFSTLIQSCAMNMICGKCSNKATDASRFSLIDYFRYFSGSFSKCKTHSF